jgi:hypothetical protein
MSVACAILLMSICTGGDGLDEARSLLRQGLLGQAEHRLVPLLADDSDHMRRAHILLLLGNVDYERGLYAQALERYVEAERDAAGDAPFVAAVSGNRQMAEQRLARTRTISRSATRLRSAVAATVFVAGAAVIYLARQTPARDAL